MAEKKIHTQTFVDGIKTSISREYMPNTAAEYILNCHILSQGEGSVGVVRNVKGNTEIQFTLPVGENICIGTANDEENNKFYYLLYNDQGKHGLYQFDALERKIVRLLENLTDTGNVDIMGLDKDYLVNHFEIIDGFKAYWVDGKNNARKTNLKKLQDKSVTGYGDVILQSFIDQYKQTMGFAPLVEYFSDPTKPFNRHYGTLRKFISRKIYDDGEISTWSDFSAVPLPSFEPFTGINTIPTDNNGIKVTIETGDRTVIQLEIAMQSTSGAPNDETILAWESVIVLDKKRLGISDDTTYTYNFYNDGNYAAVDQGKVLQPYSFMLKRPFCQAVVKNAITHANGYEGFPTVEVNVGIVTTYEDLFIESGTQNEFNEPQFTIVNNGADFVRSGIEFTRYDGVVQKMKPSGAPSRFARQTVTIGADVKEGNKFELKIQNGYNFIEIVALAGKTDSALIIASKVRQALIDTGRIYRKTPDIADTNIYDNTISGGAVSFSYIIKSDKQDNYFTGYTSVNPVQFNTLKDTGQSVNTQKLGGSEKFAFTYEDFDGRKSLAYTNDTLIIGYRTINDLMGFKKVVRTFTINHRPPVWAKYWQIVRSRDLTYGDYIQMLIQKVVTVNEDDAQDYIDLAVGSLFTYQKIHPNTPLKYEFSKGDRLRLIKNAETGTYYDFYETEVIAYNPVLTDNIQSNVVTDGTATVTVAESKIGNIGKVILIDGIEREIVDAPSGTTYLLNNVIGDTNAKTYLNFDLIDRRGTIRIRKPKDITIADNSIVELYKPSGLSNPLGSKQFFEFQKKFKVINPGTENAYHGGDVQDQSDTQPAVVRVSDGTAYVRNRELPTNNVFPGTQLLISPVEDPSYSDFYSSNLNNNGRVTAEDNGLGEVHFGDRMRFSSNQIEDTRINGLNDFANLDREDYNDQFGDIMLTVFDTNRIFVWKQLRTCYVPVDARITQDNNGTILNVNSNKLLNPIQYFAWEGGIGNNPESYSSNGTHKYFVSANSGVVIRLGFNGEEPISKTYDLDNEVKVLLTDALNNKARIFGGFDRKNGVYIITIEGYQKYIYFDGFNGWIVESTPLPENTVFQIITPPSNGIATLAGPNATYTPNNNYVGLDTFSYGAIIGGVLSAPKNVCLNIIDTPQDKGWRAKMTPYTCILDEFGLRTGNKQYDTLEEYFIFTGIATGVTKPNDPTDVDYVPPVYDGVDCSPVIPDPDPDPFTFAPVNGATLDVDYTSPVAVITGINVPVSISVNTGFYAINGGPFVNTPGTVVNNDYIELRIKSSADVSTSVSMIVTVSSYATNFVVTSEASSSFGNQEQRQTFQRNDCGPGSSGTYFEYIIPAGMYTAETQEDANNEALADIAANGQNVTNSPENASCIADTVISTFVIEVDGDGAIDCCLYIDTPGVIESGNIVCRGQNFYEAGSMPENAYMLASDNISGPTTRRFETGIGKLINLYPDATAVPQFIYKLRGRSNYVGSINGHYALKFPNQKMTMTGAPGSYIPSITPAGGPAKTPWGGTVLNGADGSIGLTVGAVIKTFTYDRASNTIIVS